MTRLPLQCSLLAHADWRHEEFMHSARASTCGEHAYFAAADTVKHSAREHKADSTSNATRNKVLRDRWSCKEAMASLTLLLLSSWQQAYHGHIRKLSSHGGGLCSVAATEKNRASRTGLRVAEQGPKTRPCVDALKQKLPCIPRGHAVVQVSRLLSVGSPLARPLQ